MCVYSPFVFYSINGYRRFIPLKALLSLKMYVRTPNEKLRFSVCLKAEKQVYPFFPLPVRPCCGTIVAQSGIAISLKGVDRVVKIFDEVLSL